ncbi:MAG TPA: hypothetical protein VJ483_00555 [Holophagaceae bacterium]|nr:hypothetical protein [Holophagaceae bacterium]
MATPKWKAPDKLAFGRLATLELREEDPGQPAIPRPVVEEKLGPLRLRALEPLPDGRGWRFTVQALAPGLAVIPPLDLGDGRSAPELRLPVPRDTAYAAPWQGFGGGREDELPLIPFPWAWASLLLLPFLALAAWVVLLWRRRRGVRGYHHAQRVFRHAWPPKAKDRAQLDEAHAKGRDLLAAGLGEAARAWGPTELLAARLEPWAQWSRSLDAARFGRTEPPFPAVEPLIQTLEHARQAQEAEA